MSTHRADPTNNLEGDAYGGQEFSDDDGDATVYGDGEEFDENAEDDDDAPVSAPDSDDSDGSSDGEGEAANGAEGAEARGAHARSIHASEDSLAQAAIHRLRYPPRPHGFPGPNSESGRERVRVVFKIPASARRTAPVLSEYEYARVLTERVASLGANGGTGFLSEKELAAIPTLGGAPTTRAIAAYEVALKKCPLSVERRCERTGIVETTPVNELFWPWPPGRAAEAIREY
jgi:hypothetical protein